MHLLCKQTFILDAINREFTYRIPCKYKYIKCKLIKNIAGMLDSDWSFLTHSDYIILK